MNSTGTPIPSAMPGRERLTVEVRVLSKAARSQRLIELPVIDPRARHAGALRTDQVLLARIGGCERPTTRPPPTAGE